MATYYVNQVGGSDVAAGTASGTAWKTFTRVWQTAYNAGDKVLFRRGDIWREPTGGQQYFGRKGTEADPILFSCYGGSTRKPSIRGLKLLDTGWAVSLNSGAYQIWGHTWSGAAAGSHQLWLNDVVCPPRPWNATKTGTYPVAATASGKFAVDHANDKIYYCARSNPALSGTLEGMGNGVTATNPYTGTLSTFAYTLRMTSCQQFRFRQLDFQGGTAATMRLEPNLQNVQLDWMRFQSCVFGKTVGQCIDVISDTGTAPVRKVRYRVETSACVFANVPSLTHLSAALGVNALRFIGAGNGTSGHTISVHDCRFSLCNHGIQIGDQGTNSAWATGAVHDNVFYKTGDDAIWSPGARRSVGTLKIYNNVIIGGGDGGIELFGTAGSGQRNVAVYHNTITSCGRTGIILTYADNTVSCFNNILANNYRNYAVAGGPGGPSLDMWATRRGTGGSGPYVNHNVYYNDGAVRALTFRWSSVNGTALASGNFAAWGTNTLHDAAGKAAYPQFVRTNPPTVDMCRISRTSPARNAGIANSRTRDFFYASVRGKPDVGAIEARPIPAPSPLGVGFLASEVL